MFDEDIAHRPSRGEEEVAAVRELHVAPDEAHVGLVDEGRRLQRRARPHATKLRCRHRPHDLRVGAANRLLVSLLAKLLDPIGAQCFEHREARHRSISVEPSQ